MNSYLPFLPAAQKWNAFLNFVHKNPLKSNIRSVPLKALWLSLFFARSFFLPIAEMGNWEVEEDDTLAVQDDDDEVRKKAGNCAVFSFPT